MKNKAPAGHIRHMTRGHVLDDLGFPPAEVLELKIRAEIYHMVVGYVREGDLPRQSIATLLNIRQPNVSHLLNGRVSKFSLGQLIDFAGKLNLTAEVKITRPETTILPKLSAVPKPRKRTAAAA